MDDLAEQFLEHPRRRLMVGGATGAVLLALTLPAFEAVADARARAADLRAGVAEARAAAANLADLQERFQALRAADGETGDGPADAGRGLTEAAAEAFRVRLTAAIRDAGAHFPTVRLEEPAATAWPAGPPPLPGFPAAAAVAALPEQDRDAAAYELVTRRLSAGCVGPPDAVRGLLTWAAAADPHARPGDLAVTFEQDADTGETALRVAFDLLLLEVRPRERPAG